MSRQERRNSKLDYIIRLMRRNDEMYIHNKGRLLSTWDH